MPKMQVRLGKHVPKDTKMSIPCRVPVDHLPNKAHDAGGQGRRNPQLGWSGFFAWVAFEPRLVSRPRQRRSCSSFGTVPCKEDRLAYDTEVP